MASIPNKNVLNGTTNPTTSQFKNEMSNLWEYINAPEFPGEVKLIGTGKISADKNGTGNYLPLTFYTGGSEKLRIGEDVGGTYTFGGTSPRIMGDFSNSTLAKRVMFQTSTVNGNTSLSVIPNGTASFAGYNVHNSSDGGNFAGIQLRASSTEIGLSGFAAGTASHLPMTFHTGGAERVRIDTSGNVLVTSASGIGYGTGAGGTVTQATSKSTAVTLNKPCGRITMNNAALGANTTVSFVFNNTLLSQYDVLLFSVVGIGSGSAANYRIWSDVANGACTVFVQNISAGSLSEALVINFAIIKGATA